MDLPVTMSTSANSDFRQLINAGSLWVAWANTYKLKGTNFWNVKKKGKLHMVLEEAS